MPILVAAIWSLFESTAILDQAAWLPAGNEFLQGQVDGRGRGRLTAELESSLDQIRIDLEIGSHGLMITHRDALHPASKSSNQAP